MFIPLMRFLLQSLVSRGLLVHLQYSFRTFSSIYASLVVSTVNIPKYLLFFFSPSVLTHSWLSSFNPCFYFPTFHYQHGTFFNAKFHSYIPAVSSYRLHQDIQFFFIFFANTFMSFIYRKWLIFHDSENLKPLVHFQST